jgi:hypothetical protein
MSGPPPEEIQSGKVMQKYKPDVPNFMRLGDVPVNYLQEVETDLLEPVVFQEGNGSTVDGFCRFQLQNKGFLHSHSKIFMSLTPPAAVTRAVYPANVGVGSVVKKAVLKIGNKVLNEISDWDHLHAFHSTKISNENNKERELYTTGRYMSRSFDFEDGSGPQEVAVGTMIQTSRDPTVVYGTSANAQQMPFAVMDGGSPTESPSYAVDLSDLFPFLKVHQLPLYMIQEPVTIELTLRPPVNHRAVRVTGTAEQSFALDRTELKFCADYIYYGATDEMERYAEQNKVLTFPFVDYRGVSTSVTQASLQTETVRNIGMASRLVNKVITMINPDRHGENNILLNLSALGMAVSSGQPGDITYNLRYNDKFEFSSNVTNTARLFSLLQNAEAMVFLSRDEYTGEGGAMEGGTDTRFETKAQSEFRGQFFFQSTRLTGGRVGQRGVELHIKCSDVRASASTLRNFCEYMRSAQLENGLVTVYNL